MTSIRPGFLGTLYTRLKTTRVWTILGNERVRYALAWTAALVGVLICVIGGWVAQRKPLRADGNIGHVSLDFSGQWLMGRMLVSGQGRHLYERNHQRAVLAAAYPREDQNPEQETSDVEAIMTALMGEDAPGGDKADAPNIGGPLYPPVDGFVYAPLGLLPPRVGYRLAQASAVFFVFVAAGGVCVLARGRLWWPLAAVFIMLFPGFAGTVGLGQNSSLSLAILIWGWLLVARNRPGWGGAVWGLLAYKPVWAAAFFLVPVLTRRWRMALAMLASGAILAALTLPFVGWQSWLHWLHVGREAMQTYNVDQNWVELSRDLLTVSRRWLIDFTLPPAKRDVHWLAPTLIGGATLLVVLEVTGRVTSSRAERPPPVDGPGAAFVLLGAWLTCFHFMYYDVLLAALPVLLLFTGPDPSFQSKGGSLGGLSRRMVPILVGHLIVTQPLWFIEAWRLPPGETILLLALWLWCGRSWLRQGLITTRPATHRASRQYPARA